MKKRECSEVWRSDWIFVKSLSRRRGRVELRSIPLCVRYIYALTHPELSKINSLSLIRSLRIPPSLLSASTSEFFIIIGPLSNQAMEVNSSSEKLGSSRSRQQTGNPSMRSDSENFTAHSCYNCGRGLLDLACCAISWQPPNLSRRDAELPLSASWVLQPPIW